MECDEVDLSTRDNVSNSDEEGEGENDDVDATSMGLQLKMAKINPPVKRGFFSRLIGMFSFFNLFSNLRYILKQQQQFHTKKSVILKTLHFKRNILKITLVGGKFKILLLVLRNWD